MVYYKSVPTVIYTIVDGKNNRAWEYLSGMSVGRHDVLLWLRADCEFILATSIYYFHERTGI